MPLRYRRWVYKNNPVLPRLYTSYDKLEYFCLPFAAGRVGLQHKTAVAQSMGLPSSFFFQLKEKSVPFCAIGSTASCIYNHFFITYAPNSAVYYC